MSDQQRDNCGKRNEHTPPAQVWVSAEKIVTFQETPAMQISIRSAVSKTGRFGRSTSSKWERNE